MFSRLFISTLLLGLGFAGTAVQAAPAQALQVLHTFGGGTSDGQWPSGSISFDAQGNLYGVTSNGAKHGYGMIFKVAPSLDGSWSETDIHDFCNQPPVCSDGAYPLGGLIFDPEGNAYGTTSYGGTAQSYGVVYKLTPRGDGTFSQSVIWLLPGTGQTSYPEASLTLDNNGRLFGTAAGNPVFGGFGSAFALSHTNGTGAGRVLYSFHAESDGGSPDTRLVLDHHHNLYGMAAEGGLTFFAGVVFELTPLQGGGWQESVIYDLPPVEDGGSAVGGVIFDASGNLYGTGNGSVFKLTPGNGGKWQHTTIFQFSGNEGGVLSGLTFDNAGNLYGTARIGGHPGCANAYGCGSVFKLTPQTDGSWKKSTVYRFTGGSDGGDPVGGVVLDSAGHLYGVTEYGGQVTRSCLFGCGVVYTITP